jgi:hypothetical protein
MSKPIVLRVSAVTSKFLPGLGGSLPLQIEYS